MTSRWLDIPVLITTVLLLCTLSDPVNAVPPQGGLGERSGQNESVKLTVVHSPQDNHFSPDPSESHPLPDIEERRADLSGPGTHRNPCGKSSWNQKDPDVSPLLTGMVAGPPVTFRKQIGRLLFPAHSFL